MGPENILPQAVAQVAVVVVVSIRRFSPRKVLQGGWGLLLTQEIGHAKIGILKAGRKRQKQRRTQKGVTAHQREGDLSARQKSPRR